MRILLDNGHGLETPGKRSPVWPTIGQLMEGQYTRDLAIRLEAALQKEQIPVQRIVPESRDVALWERVQRINLIAKRHGTANCLLVSLHVNASTSGLARGWEIHTSLKHSNYSA
jgi:N-acetylmuramoyl-L-alanine amidase